MAVNLYCEFRVMNISADSIKYSIESQHSITCIRHRYFTRKPIREKPLLLRMSRALSAVHLFFYEHQIKEATTSENKHQLAESTNSHRIPAPTGWKHQLPNSTSTHLQTET